jgi:hypothetical protein
MERLRKIKKMKRNSLIIVLSFYAWATVNAQVLNKSVENAIVKNIVSYHFRYALEFDLNLSSDGILLSDNKMFFTELWPTNENVLKISISESDLYYPKSNYKIYSIFKRGFQIGNDSVSTYRILSSFSADDKYLIAYDEESDRIKFLSGNFFKSLISGDFDLALQRPDSFYDYLKIRSYNLECKDIKFKQFKKNEVYFSAYSESLKENVLLIVGKKDFDSVSFKTLKGKVIY